MDCLISPGNYRGLTPFLVVPQLRLSDSVVEEVFDISLLCNDNHDIHFIH